MKTINNIVFLIGMFLVCIWPSIGGFLLYKWLLPITFGQKLIVSLILFIFGSLQIFLFIMFIGTLTIIINEYKNKIKK